MLVVRWLTKALKLKARGPTDHLLTVEQFRRVFERERCRADRTGTEFTTIAIGMEEGGEAQAASRTLASHLGQRLRLSDVIGWLPDGRIGILLADTGEDGAHQFCRQLRERLAGDEQLPRFDIELLIYPSPRPDRTSQAERRVDCSPGKEGNASVPVAETPGTPF